MKGNKVYLTVQRMSMFDGKRLERVPDEPTVDSLLSDGNKFQNLRVSSPAPVTMLEPQGLIPR